MGRLQPHRHPRRLRRRVPLIALVAGLALAGEIAVEGLPEGSTLTIDDRFLDGMEARDLPAGTYTLHAYGPDGRLFTSMPVMVADDERVVRGGKSLMEISRGPLPDRSAEVAPDPVKLPQTLQVVVADRGTTRVQVDNRPLAFDLATGAHLAELAPGPHELRVTVGGRVRHRQVLEIAGAPWQCGVDRLGATVCVALDPALREAPPADVDAVRERIASLPPGERLAAIEALNGSFTCYGVSRMMGLFVSDRERLEVARALRPHVVDPEHHAVLEEAVDFSPSEEALRALYGTRTP